MGKFLGWVGGILAFVIGGYILWYLERPAEKIVVEGMVIDSSMNAPVPNAMVSVEILSTANNGPYHDPTDNNGSYGLELTGLSKNANVVLRATANGFHESAAIPLVVGPGGNRKDIYITRNAPPPTGNGGNPAVVTLAPKYIQKTDMMKIYVKK